MHYNAPIRLMPLRQVTPMPAAVLPWARRSGPKRDNAFCRATAYGFGKDSSPASGSPLAVLAVTVTTMSAAEMSPTVPTKWPEPPTGTSDDPVASEDSLTVEPDLRPFASSMIPAAVWLPHSSASPARTQRRTTVEVEQLAPQTHKPPHSRSNQADSRGFIVTRAR